MTDEIEITFTQAQDPVTLYTRPIRQIMEQIAQIIASLGIACEVYDGTNLDDLTSRLAGFLTRTKGQPAAIVCYGGSTFGNFPRRTATFNCVVVSCDTRPAPGMPGALDASWKICEALDKGISAQKGDEKHRDFMEVVSEETIQLKNVGAACAIILQLSVKDF
jgi:hypothetical protein